MSKFGSNALRGPVLGPPHRRLNLLRLPREVWLPASCDLSSRGAWAERGRLLLAMLWVLGLADGQASMLLRIVSSRPVMGSEW